MHHDGTSRRELLKGGAVVVGLAAFGATFGRPGPARGAESGARGKRVEYITFGLQFEYQVAMVAGVKKKAADAGLVLRVIDGKGDPNLQVTEVLDAVSKEPDALLINPVDAVKAPLAMPGAIPPTPPGVAAGSISGR